ncbi:SDR family NAD(P)-dependent oxidoreductase [Mycobacterium szulgai]|uniref:3-beta hydroxysteroid dehydrogenase n=1 Tax=Mycobacterium szulgai TaxID=1787 RepID=A0A1X2E2A4_MYCSZ|nr:SDR family oxidoreductase [Mycobacterium szulgai]MCV7074838.1 SDR family oxidoreductase [Mycobacterium szulgai]ORW94497.1 3-beta hydroxysteroid dehydrogenase [Mycobacterium szulgai]
MAAELEGKVAIVTGACGGIGLETSRVLAHAGAHVVLADLAETDLAGAAAAVGEGAVHHAVDLTDEASVRALIDFTVDTLGRLDVVDNNAAHADVADALVTEMTADMWDQTFAVNARGTMLMCKHAIPRLISSGGGAIVNISSATAHAAYDMSTAYACTKAAIETLTRYVATQYGCHGIRCNAIAPGLVRTPKLQVGLPQPIVEIFTAHHLGGRIGEPRDIAELVCFLASDRAALITGQVIAADSGLLAHLPAMPQIRALLSENSCSA